MPCRRASLSCPPRQEKRARALWTFRDSLLPGSSGIPHSPCHRHRLSFPGVSRGHPRSKYKGLSPYSVLPPPPPPVPAGAVHTSQRTQASLGPHEPCRGLQLTHTHSCMGCAWPTGRSQEQTHRRPSQVGLGTRRPLGNHSHCRPKLMPTRTMFTSLLSKSISKLFAEGRTQLRGREAWPAGPAESGWADSMPAPVPQLGKHKDHWPTNWALPDFQMQP